LRERLGIRDDLVVDDLPNNPLKLPFLLAMAVVTIVLIVVAAEGHAWVWVAILAGCLLGGTHAIRVVRQGRNPRWLRSPLDRGWQRRSK
jgi:hypothetical protein